MLYGGVFECASLFGVVLSLFCNVCYSCFFVCVVWMFACRLLLHVCLLYVVCLCCLCCIGFGLTCCLLIVCPVYVYMLLHCASLLYYVFV